MMTRRAGLWLLGGEERSARRQRRHEHWVQLSRHKDHESRSVASQWRRCALGRMEEKIRAPKRHDKHEKKRALPHNASKHFSRPPKYIHILSVAMNMFQQYGNEDMSTEETRKAREEKESFQRKYKQAIFSCTRPFPKQSISTVSHWRWMFIQQYGDDDMSTEDTREGS
jgi:hypothetical protein